VSLAESVGEYTLSSNRGHGSGSDGCPSLCGQLLHVWMKAGSSVSQIQRLVFNMTRFTWYMACRNTSPSSQLRSLQETHVTTLSSLSSTANMHPFHSSCLVVIGNSTLLPEVACAVVSPPGGWRKRETTSLRFLPGSGE
jgi:hypothetical protein